MIKTRTLGVTLFTVLVLFFAVASLARAAQAIQKWQFLADLLPIWPGYLVTSGLVWFGVGAWLSWHLWTERGVGNALVIAIVLYSANFWLERYWLTITGSTNGPNDNWPFVLTVNVFVLVWSVWELYRPRRQQRSEERYEQ